MLTPSNLLSRWPSRGLLPVFLLLASVVVAPARADVLKPWAPPGDDLRARASSARLRFQKQVGDSVGGTNMDGYTVVGEMGRKLFASLGKEHMGQAKAFQPTLDSLGLDVEIATDPATSYMVFMLVRNPFKRSSDGVGFIYWLRGDQLRMQGASVPPSRGYTMKSWWTGRQDSPYELALLYSNERDEGAPVLDLFRLDVNGFYWNLIQYAGHGPQLRKGTSANFVDVNADGQPELVAYQPLEPDSIFVLKSDVPRWIEERIYTERPEGFVLHDLRPLPGPIETLRMFTALLSHGDAPRARRLMLKPAALDTLLAIGWGRHSERGAFTAEYGEPYQNWPEWIELKVREDKGWHRWIVHFWIEDGRWVIRDIIPVRVAHPRPVRTPGMAADTLDTAQP